MCSPERIRLTEAVAEVQAASKAVAALLENESALAVISKAAVNLDCVIIRSQINEAGFQQYCEIICWLICTWRCAWVCRELCTIRTPILTGVDAIEEARSFALATRAFASKPRGLSDLVTAVLKRDGDAYSEIIGRWGLGPYCWQVCGWICWGICREFCICICPPPHLRPWFTTVGLFDIYTQIDPASGKTNTSLTHTVDMPSGGGPNFAFYDSLQLGGYCPTYSPTSPGALMRYRFLYSSEKTTLSAAINAAQTSLDVTSPAASVPPFNISVCVDGQSGETMTVTGVSGTHWTVTRAQKGTTASTALAGADVWIDPKPITGPLVNPPVLVGQRIISWPQNNLGFAGPPTSTFEQIYVGYGTDPVTPAPGAPHVAPQHFVPPDITTGWVEVDPENIAGGFQVLLKFDTPQVVPGGDPLPGAFGHPGGTPAGQPVPAASQKGGTDLAIIFQATRVSVSSVDYSNSLCKIRINNWNEVNNLWFQEFGVGDCCNPIDATLNVQFTVDHEEMDSGGWSLSITSCSTSAPGDIKPAISSAGPPPVTVSPRGGFGTVVENTSNWNSCSYTVELGTSPGLTTGLHDRSGEDNLLTFCICGHETPPPAAAGGKGKRH